MSSLKISTASWPNKLLAEVISLKASEFFNKLISQQQIDTNLIKFSIGYDNFNVDVLVEQQFTTLPAIVGTIGGLLGLWCGISMMTIVEHVELCIVAVLNCTFWAPVLGEDEEEEEEEDKGGNDGGPIVDLPT